VYCCTRDNVPYFIRLCRCEAPEKDLLQWRSALSKINKSTKYTDTYAHNLDNFPYQQSIDIKDIIALDSDRSFE